MPDTKKRSIRFSMFSLLCFVTVICVVIFWFSRPKRFQVTALLAVSCPTESRNAKEIHGKSTPGDSKKELLSEFKTSPDIREAICDTHIAQLSLVKKHLDTIGWLRKSLRMECFNDSGQLGLSLTVKDSELDEAKQLIAGVARKFEVYCKTSSIECRRPEGLSELVEKIESLRHELDSELKRLPSLEVAGEDLEALATKEKTEKLKVKLRELASAMSESAQESEANVLSVVSTNLIFTTYLGRW